MKVKIVAGRLTAEAETTEDMQTLLALATGTKTKTGKMRKPRKRMYSSACAICGKRKKLMTRHMQMAHPAAYAAMQQTSAA